MHSGVSSASQDPYLLQRFAELWLQLRTATMFADVAADQLDVAWCKGDALIAEERGAVAVAVAEAKVLAHRASLDIGTQLFDVAGAVQPMVYWDLIRFLAKCPHTYAARSNRLQIARFRLGH